MNTYIKKTVPLFFGLLLLSACDHDDILPSHEGLSLSSDAIIAPEGNTQAKENKITGDIQFTWTANKGMENGKKPEDLLAFASITAHERNFSDPERNNFTYTILNADMTLHREIVIAINGVFIDSDNLKGYITGTVTSDTKGCSGGPNGGHSSNCQGGGCAESHDEHDGGCSGDHSDTGDTGGGCSGDHTDTGDTGGGCTGDHTDTDGGCTGDHTDTGSGSAGGPADSGGGCSGDHPDTGDTGGSCSGDHTDTGDTGGGCSGDHTDTGDGCSGSGGSGQAGGSGNTVSGKNCRVGQVIAIKVHDKSTPGSESDGITWKWYDPGNTNIPTVNDINTFVKLCKKNIIEGNIVVHTK